MATIELPYSFYGGVREGMLCRAGEVCLEGPADTGKTLGLLYKIHNCADKYPGAQISIIRKTRNDLTGTVLQTWKRDILQYAPYVQTVGGEHPEKYNYPNGSCIWIGGLDRPGKTLSGERDIVYVAQLEEDTQSDWEYLIRMTSGRGAVMPYTQVVSDCNPATPSSWILQRAKAGKLKLFKTTHRDNPSIFNRDGTLTLGGEKRLARLRNLTGHRLKRLYYGLWAPPEGAIYSMYDEERHKVKSFAIPRLWPRFVGVDPFGAKIAAVWVAYDPQGQVLHVYREYSQPFGITTGEHVKAILRESGYNELGSPLAGAENIFAWVGGGPSERQQRVDFSGFGLPLVPSPVTDVWAGIDRVASLLDEGSLVIHDCCVELLSEIGEMRRKENKATGEFTDQIENKNDWHCFVGDTLVTTINGDVPIRDIRPGHFVLTRLGYQRVLKQACTNQQATVYWVALSNGHSIVGTSEHPVFVKGKGYTGLLALRYGDILFSKEEVISQWNEKQSSMMVELGADTQMQKSQAAKNTTQRWSMENMSTCIDISGNSTMVQSQKIALYITSMEPSQTTLLRTLHYSHIPNTPSSILPKRKENSQDSILRLLDHWRQNGIDHQRVERGTANMEEIMGE